MGATFDRRILIRITTYIWLIIGCSEAVITETQTVPAPAHLSLILFLNGHSEAVAGIAGSMSFLRWVSEKLSVESLRDLELFGAFHSDP
ncbi:hypothetical protein ANANG_G00041440 [Anguilla anguilla]|uniref:Uncharacterized protein n=1 Tax=Anguilla anguilla TaxID=7936 RepID=A0A9D3S7P6_ANGAN|nr:hypothetical protein ANANG_G00041440 [Anguilla anguilla]